MEKITHFHHGELRQVSRPTPFLIEREVLEVAAACSIALGICATT